MQKFYDSIPEIVEVANMTGLEFILSGATLVLTILLGLLMSAYLPSYTKEKAKNLATKEDVAEITRKVEKVRADFLRESALLENRRNVYERVANSLRVFIDGHQATDAQKEEFHAAYSACWLWGADDVAFKLNEFISMQEGHASSPVSYTQDEMKERYADVIICMRRDAGFSQTGLDGRDFKFVRF